MGRGLAGLALMGGLVGAGAVALAVSAAPAGADTNGTSCTGPTYGVTYFPGVADVTCRFAGGTATWTVPPSVTVIAVIPSGDLPCDAEPFTVSVQPGETVTVDMTGGAFIDLPTGPPVGCSGSPADYMEIFYGFPDVGLGTPADITGVNATSPKGAVVTYPAPAVSDPDDTTLPTPTCTPGSGSVFAIGTTTVNCTVTDPNDYYYPGYSSPPTTSFNVTVLGAPAQLANLQTASPGKILQGTVGVTASQLAGGHTKLACLALAFYVFEVKIGQAFHLISTTTANQLVASAKNIEAVIPC